jgi:hypothetical protein
MEPLESSQSVDDAGCGISCGKSLYFTNENQAKSRATEYKANSTEVGRITVAFWADGIELVTRSDRVVLQVRAATLTTTVPIARLDRVTPSEAVGCAFERRGA